MKKIKLLLFATSLLLTGMHATAQTADEIIAKHVEAMGGKEKLASLKTIRMSGSTSAQGMDIPLTITKSHLTGMRLDLEAMGNSYYQFANATKGMTFMPGMTDPVEMDAESLKAFSNQMDIQGALFNYKEKGSTVELVGSEKVDGADTYNLKVTFKSGKTANYFVDKTTSRILKSTSKVDMQGQEMEVYSTFADYKQNADGYWFSYAITSQRGTINFDKIESNIAVDEKIYSN